MQSKTWFYQHPCMAWTYSKMHQTPHKNRGSPTQSASTISILLYDKSRETPSFQTIRSIRLDIKFINKPRFPGFSKLWETAFPASGTCPTRMCARPCGAKGGPCRANLMVQFFLSLWPWTNIKGTEKSLEFRKFQDLMLGAPTKTCYSMVGVWW